MVGEWLAVGITILTVSIVFWLSRIKQRWVQLVLNWFPAILFAYVIPALFTHAFGLDLKSVFLHDLSRNWIIPFTILTVMSALPFAQLKIVGIKPIILFVVGSFFIAILPFLLVVGFTTFDPGYGDLFIDQQYWKGLVPIVGGWIGGSTSQLVLKEVIDTEEALFLSILVLDNILVNIWTILMFQFIKRSESLNARFKIDNEIRLIDEHDVNRNLIKWGPGFTLFILLMLTFISYLLPLSFLQKVILLSLLGLLLGNVLKKWNVKFVLMIGGVAIIVIMAILGLRLDFSQLSLPAVLVVLVVIWLVLHFILMLVTAILLRINICWVPIASMANLGGISTAPAVTAAFRKDLMPHAILLAILSMVSGTAWGLFTIFLFETFV